MHRLRDASKIRKKIDLFFGIHRKFIVSHTSQFRFLLLLVLLLLRDLLPLLGCLPFYSLFITIIGCQKKDVEEEELESES